MRPWKIVDENGDEVISAKTIGEVAKERRLTPRIVAQREARDMVNIAAGDAPVFAVPAC